MGKSDLYRIRVKSGRNLIDVRGDKKFAEKIFSDLKEIFPKTGKMSAPKKRGRKPKPKPSFVLSDLTQDELIHRVNNNKESFKILVSCYCINKKLGKYQIKAKDLCLFMDSNGMQIPKYTAYHFKNMKEKGFLKQVKIRGRYKITDNGIKFIEAKLSGNK